VGQSNGAIVVGESQADICVVAGDSHFFHSPPDGLEGMKFRDEIWIRECIKARQVIGDDWRQRRKAISDNRWIYLIRVWTPC
jgi:hypothetical protein